MWQINLKTACKKAENKFINKYLEIPYFYYLVALKCQNTVKTSKDSL